MRINPGTIDTGLIFRQDSEERFRNYWNDYVRIYQTSPQYLLTNLDYLLAYSSSLYKDKSFVYIKNREVVACVFLPIEAVGDTRSVTIGKDFVIAPLFQLYQDIGKYILDKIEAVAREEGIEKILFRIDPLEHESYPYNFLMSHDYLDASLLGYLVDCQNIAMRRNHHRAIKKIISDGNFEVQIMDKQNSDYSIHEQYRLLHHRSAGKVTRSKESFDLQFKLLQEGAAILIGLIYKDNFVAFTYFSHHGSKAVSFSAADDPDFHGWPLYHIINANAFEYFHRNGIKEIDMGQPLNISHQLFYYPDEKQINISLFKTGFGGRFVPNFRGIKYFSRRAFRDDMDKFIKNYENSISE